MAQALLPWGLKGALSSGYSIIATYGVEALGTVLARAEHMDNAPACTAGAGIVSWSQAWCPVGGELSESPVGPCESCLPRVQAQLLP